MNNPQFIENIGWVLVHSLWQISLITALLFCILRFFGNVSANLRYLLCVAALFLVMLMPIATFFSFSSNPTPKNGIVFGESEKKIPVYTVKTANKDEAVFSTLNESSNSKQIEEKQLPTFFEGLKVHFESLFAKFLPYLVWFWLFGVMLFSIRLGGGVWKTYQFKKLTTSPVSKEWQEKFDNLCKIVGITQTVKLVQSEIVETPAVIGWLKPFVIIPSSVLLGLKPNELETIITHELIHIRRYDYFVNLLQSFAEIILFFHPLTWWISAQIRRERENACDDEVLKIFDNEPLLYANALTNLEELRLQTNNLILPNLVAANGGNLMLRIQRIIKTITEKHNSKSSLLSASLAFLLTFTISTALLSSIWYQYNQIPSNEIKEEITKIDSKRLAIAVYSASQFLIIEDIEDADETMAILTENLKKHQIPVVGYANGSSLVKVDDKSAREDKIVNLWQTAGFEIGVNFLKFPNSLNKSRLDYKRSQLNNPIFSYKPLFNEVTYLLGKMGYKDGLPKTLTEKDKEKMRNIYQNMSSEERDKMQKETLKSVKERDREERKWLNENNLKPVNFTINSVDWMYSNVYDSARKNNDKKLMKYVQTQYIEYLSNIFDFYETNSQQIFNRQIPQTFGLEPSRLVADSLDGILEMVQKRGYKFVSMDEALKDEAFQNESRGFGARSSFFDSPNFPAKIDSSEKPKPNEDIMTAWYGQDTKN